MYKDIEVVRAKSCRNHDYGESLVEKHPTKAERGKCDTHCVVLVAAKKHCIFRFRHGRTYSLAANTLWYTKVATESTETAPVAINACVDNLDVIVVVDNTKESFVPWVARKTRCVL